jgi:parallel beta-helix repeat protein
MTPSSHTLTGALLLAVVSGSALAAGEPTQVAVQSYPSSTSAWVSWASDATAPNTAFRVERRTVGSRGWFAVSGNLSASTRGFGEGQLRNNAAYEYRVVAILSSGTNLVSPTTVVLNTPSATATQAEYDAAAAPRQVDAQAVSNTEIIVTWADQTPDETHFKVERRQGNGLWSAVATLPADSVLYRDSGLNPASSYQYRVAAERNGQLPATSDAKLAATPATGSTTLRYVDGSACNTGTNNGSMANPWRTIQLAAWSLSAGQTVLVRNRADCATPTVYRTNPNATTGRHSFAIVDISNDTNQNQFATGGTRSGTPTAWITYRNYPGERPKLRTARGGLTSGGYSTSDAGNYNGISVRNVSYIVIDGFEIEGHLNDVTLAEATALNAKLKADFVNQVAPALRTPITPVIDANGISVGTGISSTQTNRIPHQIIVRNNVVYNMPGAGVGGSYADWLTFENNRVSNSSWYTPYGSSPMGVLLAKDVDTNTTAYKIVFRGNHISGSGNLFPCNCFSFIQPTDGNGLILDLFRSTAGGLAAYSGRSLITNNVITDNGGRGIHIFNSQNADIVFNTLVRNNTIAITGDGELSSQRSRNVRAYNNIVVARTDRPTHVMSFPNAAAKLADGASVEFDHNIISGGNPAASQVAVTATQNGLGASNRLNLDPRFVAITGANAFRLRANSPAVDSAWNGVSPLAVDFFGAPRPRGTAADVGAVESY